MRLNSTHFSMALLAAAACLAAAGCGGNAGVKGMQRSVDSMQAVVDLLKSVTDAESARAATPKVEPAYQEMLDALEGIIAYEKEHGMVRGRKTTIDKITKDLGRLQRELQAEGQRLNRINGLPEEFWDVAHVQSYRLVVAGLEALLIANPNGDRLALDLMKQVSGLYDELGGLKIVEVSIRNTMWNNREKALERLRAIVGPGGRIIDMDDPERPNAMLAVVAPVGDYDAFIKQIDFGEVTEQDRGRRELVIEMRPDTEARVAGVRDRAAELQREQLEAVRSMERDARMEESLKRADEVFREADPNAPDYHEQLVSLLNDERAMHHDDAVRKLLELRPADVGDKELRTKIARGFRELALSTTFERDEAVRGLVIWGGKYSVPVLIEVLEKERFDREPALRALGELATPEGATAVARYLGEFRDHENAVASLRKMGAVAEDALMEAAPSNDEEVSYAAVELLGDVGTKKSFMLLRQAARSRNVDVKEAALSAIRKIQNREKESAG